MRNVIIVAAVGIALFVTGVAAQHAEHQNDQTAPKAEKADPAKAADMKSQMSQRMMGQNEMAKLVDQLQESFAAIETEIDPVALKQRLAAHGTLLKELQTKTHAQSHMMETMMQHMMNGSMMGAQPKK